MLTNLQKARVAALTVRWLPAAHTQMEIGRLVILARVRQLNNENDL